MSHEVLILALTRMKSGLCTAGFINQPHPASGLTWVRPVKEHSSLLLGDMTDADGRVVQIGDVVSLNLLHPRPDPPHTEDWLTDFVRQRPRLLRQLSGQKRADFLARHVDQCPAEVLQQHTRSLCLIRPSALWATFSLDDYSGKYEAYVGFQQDGLYYPAPPTRGVPVTDLKWRALGRQWLAEERAGRLKFSHDELHGRLAAGVIYLAIGLSRSYKGTIWPLVVGVHVVPDYAAVIDYDNL
ncbi:MAG: hypothetical protein AB1791_14435 [Chloroflexota bacterium]